MSRLPPSASVAAPMEGGKLFAPSAARNVSAVVRLLADIAPATGRALEIASGTGQHVCALAAALPALEWHPSEIAADRVASINAHAQDAGLRNLHPAQILDATTAGWSAQHSAYDLVHLGNLLHLIAQNAARTVLQEGALVLAVGGLFVIYGPFLRAGRLTSPGDAEFDAQLRAADPATGYKDDQWIAQTLALAGLALVEVRPMPANNLAFIARKEPL
jgi:hypothetical protein